MNKRRPRIMFFDIESTDLKASFGHVLAFGYKYADEKKPRVISLADFPTPKIGEEPDLHLLKAVHRLLTDEADIIVSWYGKGFDRKFLNSRMLIVGLPPLPPLSAEHIDLYFTARGNLAIHSNRLQAVSEALGCPYSKTPVRADTWRQAMRGDKKAVAYVIEHCRLDVLILEWVYYKLRPLVRQHPPKSEHKDRCRVCGVSEFRSNGIRFRYGQQDRRLQCAGCGAWSFQNVKTSVRLGAA